MPCDGKSPNCDRRRILLAQLKCLISSMNKKKPCEWDEPSCPPIVYCPTELCTPLYCKSVKPCKFFNFRASIMYRCECIKRNGLQDRCMMWNCMGRPECLTELYPICEPGYAALMKLTDLGDMDIVLRRFCCADQAEAALVAYCRLTCDKIHQRQVLLCDKINNDNIEALCASAISTARSVSNARNNSENEKSVFLNDFSSSYQFCVPSSPYILQSCDIY